jgi:hypothetical protein
MNRTLHTTLLAGSTVLVSAPALAQTAPEWNRRIEAIAVQPAVGGGHTIYTYVGVEASGLLTTTDLSLELLVFVNGTAIDMQTLDFVGHPAGAGGPGPMCQTNQDTICFDGGPGGTPLCICSNFVAPSSSNASLQPGDELMILLRPAPGAVPESDTSDDVMTQLFDGEETGWNRRIQDVRIVPSSAPPPPGAHFDSFFDIEVQIDYATRYDGRLNLDAEIEIRVNGTPTRNFPVPNDLVWAICPGGGCSQACAFDGGVPTVFCDDGGGSCGCAGGGGTFPCPAVPANPNDVITVILRPVPGALPELPGFPEDEEEERIPPCAGDIAGPAGPGPDGNVDALDFLLMISQWGSPCVGSCEADITGPGGVPDGNVDALDFLLLISQWGNPGNCPAPV